MTLKRLLMGFAAAALLAGFTIAGAVATEKRGAEEIELDGGQRGKIPFPHHRHQDKLEDCKICHSVFPQEAGIIAKLKAEGSLEKKQVMNKLCTKCHREAKKAGQPSGPTTCTKCHIKERS